jgi:uncharacterized protein involved in tolerance to divalent cations
MTQDEIIEMARQVGYPIQHPEWQKATEEFAALVAAKEREACAKVADKISDKYGWTYFGNEVDTADEIAAAIRARGEQA